MMRLDKFLTNVTSLSRSEATKAIKSGRVKVEGLNKINSDTKIDENVDIVYLDNNKISYFKYIYIMLNKPQGVVSATTDKQQKTVLDLIPKELQKFNLFPCGRLDKDTLGLVILTNNGLGAHKLLAPKNHVSKTYKFEIADKLSESHKQKIEAGILLADGYITRPCHILMTGLKSGEITITEGKYHEIKRMFGAVGNKITYLERISFGSIKLDTNLKRGEYRYLTPQESAIFE